MVGAAIFQRFTGPTNPLRDTVRVGDAETAYRLRRSGTTTGGARIEIPAMAGVQSALLHYRRYPTTDPFVTLPMAPNGDRLAASLPVQPAAGKMEYFITLATSRGDVRMPEPADGTVILRYKDPVPAAVLAPHVALMFFAVLFGIRAGVGATVNLPTVRRDAWTALALMTVGGMILGPIVQQYAFGAYWTGVPFGYDLTDNKTLLMWLAWLGACAALAPRFRLGEMARRRLVLAAAIVMMVVYLIPHSLRGSELDYTPTDDNLPEVTNANQ
jgi:hypothetical protein